MTTNLSQLNNQRTEATHTISNLEGHEIDKNARLTAFVKSLDEAIALEVASEEAQQAYTNNPNSSSYTAWLGAKADSEDAVSALNTPKIESVYISHTSGDFLQDMGQITAEVTFSDDVVITGEVSIELNLNPNSPSHSIKIATFEPSSSDSTHPRSTLDLIYSPTSSDGNPLVSSMEVVANSLSLAQGSTIVSEDGVSIILDHSGTVNGSSNTSSDTMGFSVPQLTSISVLEMDGRELLEFDVVTVVAKFNQAMFLTDAHNHFSNVSFSLQGQGDNDSTGHQALLASGDGTSTLTYEYTVKTDDNSIATLAGAPSLDDDYGGGELIGSATILGDSGFGTGTSIFNFSGMTQVNNLDYALSFPGPGSTAIVKGDPGGFGSLALEEYSLAGPSTFSFDPQTADVVKITNVTHGGEYTATRNSDGTVLIDGGHLGRVLLQDVNYLTDGDEDQFFNIGLEDYLATESSKDHKVSGSIFGGDELVVDELANVNLKDSGWEAIDATTSVLRDTGDIKRAELTEVAGKTNVYTLETFLANGSTAHTYEIEGTEVLSVRGLNSTKTKDLGSADVSGPTVDYIEVTSSATHADPHYSGADIVVAGNVVTATVEFTEAVFVQGNPTIQLQIGNDPTNLVDATFVGNSNHTFVQNDWGYYVELEAPFSDSITPSKLQAFTYVIKAHDIGVVTIVTNKLNLDGGSILDAAGNAADLTYSNTNYSNAKAPYMDAPPTVTITMEDSEGNAISGLKKGETAEVTFTFSEVLSEDGYFDVGHGAIEHPNGTITSLLQDPNDPTKYKATYTPKDNIEDTTNVITFDMTKVEDLLGNSGVGKTSSANYEVDTKTPTVTITMADSKGDAISGLIKGETAEVTFTFSEGVSPVVKDSLVKVIQADNGEITDFEVDGSDPTKYTATYKPDDDVETDQNYITVQMSEIKDAAGNIGSGLSGSSSIIYSLDTLIPTINTSDTEVIFNEDTNIITVNLVFSELVELATGATLELTLLIEDDTGAKDEIEVITTAFSQLTYSKTYTFLSIDPLREGLFDIDGIQVKADSLKVVGTDNLKDLAGNLVSLEFGEFQLHSALAIDSRTNRDTKQDEGYVAFSDLLPSTPDDANKSLDDSDAQTINSIKTITGGAGMDQIFGGVDAEHLIGGDGHDFLKGGDGDDTLDGGAGDDYLYADKGNDEIKGGEGIDTILFDKIIQAENKLVLDLFKDVSAQADNAELGSNTISGIENAIGTNMGDVMNGNGYDNIINGADGDDIINGGRGNDELLGGAGNDTLKGGRGKDTLEGGAGKDILNGGAGADTFVFTLADLTMTEDTDASGYFTSTHSDTVQRFNARADKIEIIGDHQGQVNLKGGNLFIDVKDVNGDFNSHFDDNTDWLLAEGFHNSITYTAGSGDVAFLDLSSFNEIT